MVSACAYAARPARKRPRLTSNNASAAQACAFSVSRATSPAISRSASFGCPVLRRQLASSTSRARLGFSHDSAAWSSGTARSQRWAWASMAALLCRTSET
jgi:hypothetical protein